MAEMSSSKPEEKPVETSVMPAPGSPSKPSKGEKIFDWVTYSGINYWTNLGLSILIADYFRNLSGRKHLDKIIGGSTRMLSNLVAPEKAHRYSTAVWETTALVSGGWVILPFMKGLEDNKRPIVHWLNNKLGVEQKGADGHFLKPEEIYIADEQPRQSWSRVVGRRVLAAIAVMFGAGPAVEYTVGEKKATDFIVRNVNKGARYVPGGQWFTNNERAQRYLGFAALDAVYTKVSAIVMHLTNGAKKARLPHEIGDDNDPKPEHVGLGPVGMATVSASPATSFVERTAKPKVERAPQESFAAAVKSREGGANELGLAP